MNPPNVPGPSNLPPSGASGGMQMGGAPSPKSSGGLFTARNIIIGLIALSLCLCGCVIVIPLVSLTLMGPAIGNVFSTIKTDLDATPSPLATTTIPLGQAQVRLVGTDFMQKMKNGDWAGAYERCTPNLQKELGSASALGKRVTDGKVQPLSWDFKEVSQITPTTKEAQIDGTAMFAGNRTGTVRLVLDRIGIEWKISGFNLKFQ